MIIHLEVGILFLAAHFTHCSVQGNKLCGLEVCVYACLKGLEVSLCYLSSSVLGELVSYLNCSLEEDSVREGAAEHSANESGNRLALHITYGQGILSVVAFLLILSSMPK